MTRKTAFALMYALSPLLPILAIFASNTHKYSMARYAIPMAAGCMAYTWLCGQVVMSGRFRFIEKNFGLDRIYRFHGMMAVAAIGLSLLHKQIEEMLMGEYLATKIGTLAILVFIGVSGAALLVMADTLTSRIPSLGKLRSIIRGIGVDYDMAALIHTFSMAGVVLMFVHISMASSFASSTAVRLIVASYFLIALASYVSYKILSRGYDYKVEEVICESPDVTTLRLVPAGARAISYDPGQFAYLSMGGGRSHPFTISSSPVQDGSISFTIKSLGDFSEKIRMTRLGDMAVIRGPYGRFSYRMNSPRKEYLFIAGGIGVTPFLSAIRHMGETGFDGKAVLLWGARSEKDIIVHEELKGLQDTIPGFSLVTVVSGAVDGDTLEGVYGTYGLDRNSCAVYICGPPAMSSGAAASLRRMAVPMSAIFTERFSM